MFGVLKAFELFSVRSILIGLGAILTAFPSAADIVTQRVQGWELTKSTDPISDVSSYWISRPSADGDIELALKCDSEGASPYLFFILGRKPELIGLDDVSGRLRIDANEPVNVLVFGDHRSAQISSDGLAKISTGLKSGSRLAFELSYSNVSELLRCATSGSVLALRSAGLCEAKKSSVSGTVSLSGSTKAIDWLLEHCGSLPENTPDAVTDPDVAVEEIDPAALAAEKNLADKLQAEAESNLRINLVGDYYLLYGSEVVAKIDVINQTDYYYCSNPSGYSIFHRFEFFQNAVNVGESRVVIQTAKDDVGLDTKCIAPPKFAGRFDDVEVPEVIGPDALLLQREFSLKSQELALRMNPYAPTVRTSVFTVDAVRLADGGFYKLERVRNSAGRYEYRHIPVDWLEEARRLLQANLEVED